MIQKDPFSVPDRQAPGVFFFIPAEFFKSAWEYRKRAFRYLLLDTGHLVENFMLATKALGLSSRMSYDFEDKQVSNFLGLDNCREMPTQDPGQIP
ncbi:nitroreductase family protein [Desulfospira joergensenii]|uniref:nitroreductase family protein n=1 Tax=Desulfospira joergensenii TaxID=53329 RepID=UPI0003B72F8F|nr:nitroreductase family protein [Desulfospira joergensenii]